MGELGIIMQLRDRNAIVMTKSGAFVRIPRRPNMEVGMEVPVNTARRRRRVPMWQRVSVAVAAACMVAVSGVWFGIGQMGDDTAFAYVSMDINPSIAFTIDKSEHVMAVSGLNPDGMRLAAKLHVDHESLKQAVQTAINAAVTNHMLPNEDAILITAAPASNSADIATLTQAVKQDVESAVAANQTAKELQPHIYTLQVSNPVWQAATKADISPGKLASYLIAQKEGYHYTLSDLKGQTLGSVLGQSSKAESVVSALQSKNAANLKTIMQSLQQQAQQDDKPQVHLPHNQVTLPTHPQNGTVSIPANGVTSSPGAVAGTRRPITNGSGIINQTVGAGAGVAATSGGITVTIGGQQFHLDLGKSTSRGTHDRYTQSPSSHASNSHAEFHNDNEVQTNGWGLFDDRQSHGESGFN